jgi:phage FluMu protein Com
MIELRCKQCDRFMGEAVSIVGEIVCPNTSCKAGNQFKILTADESKLVSFKFPSAPRPAKVKQEKQA